MGCNFISENADIRLSQLCLYDTSIGYDADFSNNGDVDRWEYFDGIHTYGCWGGFLFGTLFTSYALIGRYNVFSPVPAETHYIFKIAIKINLIDRLKTQDEPTKGRVMWKTLSRPMWDSEKTKDFTIYPDGDWHVYILNMGEKQWWQGDINDLRIYPILENGVDGDEIYIRKIQIVSSDTWECKNANCSYFTRYSHPCLGVGLRGRCESFTVDTTVSGILERDDELFFTIEKNINDEFIVDINGYGNEVVKLDEISFAGGKKVAKILAKNIAKTNIGGYSEVEVEYDTDNKKFIIYSGTYTDDSSVKVVYNKASIMFGFFNVSGVNISSEYLGETPATEFEPLSTFRLNTVQLLEFFSGDSNAGFEFNSGLYNIEGGRRDWLTSGLGVSENSIAAQDDTSGNMVRQYSKIDNEGKTLIDFCHPFNASGRIKKVCAACTLDNAELKVLSGYSDRRDAESVNASIKIIRTRKDGTMYGVHSIKIPDRDRSAGQLYSVQQEITTIDCDIWVNKGDLLGIYNANVYAGKTVTGNEVDALYFQVDGEIVTDSDTLTHTDDLCEGGTVVASSVYGNFYSEYAFDNDKNTCWKSSSGGWSWIQYGFGEGNKKVVTRLRLRAVESFSDFVFKGSNDGIVWSTLIAGVYSDIWWKTYDFSNSECFRYYRLDAYGTPVTICEIEFMMAYNQPTTDIFNPGELKGQGDAGLLIYARSGVVQHKIAIDVDLGNRVNIKDVVVSGESENSFLEFNIARCLDINWEVDLFGLYHSTGYVVWNPKRRRYYTHPNLCYGVDKLTDGDLGANDGLAADDFYVEYGAYQDYFPLPTGVGKGLVPTNSRYFQVNGDAEWLGIYLQAGRSEPFVVDFEYDPIAFTLFFPYQRKRKIYKSSIYFKERYNMRSFALSTYLGPNIIYGNADDPHFEYIPEYTAVILDDVRITKDSSNYGNTDLYLFANPTIGHMSLEQVGDTIIEFDDTTAYWDPMHGLSFLTTSKIVNQDQNLQAMQIDWNVLEHEWEPIECQGFRFYCNYHKSTKINEMELYAFAGESDFNISEDITLTYSSYQDLWWMPSVVQTDDGSATVFIGDTPRYFRFEIQPISTIRLKGVVFNVDIDDVFVGAKGCEYNVYLDSNKKGVINESQKIDIKNVYGKSYDLYVDIAADKGNESGTIFHSKLDSVDSVENPEVGSDAYYVKQDDYPLVNTQNNCAINCPCYGLMNLIDGKKAYYSYDDQYTWYEFGTLTKNVNIDFSNVLSSVTVINLPLISRNKYWKIGFLCNDVSTNVREMNVFYDGEELNCVYYHDKNLVYEEGPTSDTAPHLHNRSVTGSYYVLEENQYIGVELDGLKSIDRITLYHDHLSEYCEGCCGIDKVTSLCIQGKGPYYFQDDIVDCSYYEHDVNVVGNVHIDNAYSSGDLFVDLLNVSANSYYSNNSPDKTIDDDLGTYWICRDIPAWWMYDFGTVSGTVANYLSIIGHSLQYYRITNFDIQCSNNGSNWTTTASGLSMPSDNKKGMFHFSNSVAYRYYRIYIYSATYNQVIINEMELMYKDPNISLGLTSELPLIGDNGCIKFEGGDDEYLEAPYAPCLFVDGSKYVHPNYAYFSLDFWIKFKSYPASKVYLISGVFELTVEHMGGEQVKVSVSNGTFTRVFKLNQWHHIFIRGATATKYGSLYIYLNGDGVHGSGWSSNEPAKWGTDGLPFVVGSGFDGWIAELRYVVHENQSIYNYYAFTKQYERYYTMSIYTSGDNLTYYKYCDVDLMFENSYSYYFTGNKFSEVYYSYLAIDLEKSYDLELIRSYGAADSEDCSLIENVIYSSSNTSNIDDVVFGGNYTDTRWVCATLLNDGATRKIYKLGIYPNMSIKFAPGGGYNTEWDSLDEAITIYKGGKNLALGTTISGSSQFSFMDVTKIVDGAIGETIYDVWGSDTNSTQSVVIDLEAVYSIYRVKIYHGILKVSSATGEMDKDDDYMVIDYTIEASEDGTVFITMFDITNNDELERIHDLVTPVSARYIKINITNYRSRKVSFRTTTGYDFFEGALLREVEIYEYYGFTSISSEEYPIICINLRDQFYLSGHGLVGIDPESYKLDPRARADWTNEDSNFRYSDSVLNDPRDTVFGDWGGAPIYEQWVAVKRNVATCYPIKVPYIVGYDQFPADSPNYLKHVLVKTTIEPNPCDYNWWWYSKHSTLSNTYAYSPEMCLRMLQIDYPISSGVDTISFIEGDNFGIDAVVSWRDGLHMRLYIDDVNNLDNYGYFYFGGYDVESEPVIYKWYLETLISGTITSGWNNFSLRFSGADEVTYTQSPNPLIVDTRIVKNLTLQTIGLIFRGKNSPITMIFDGFEIARNHFADTMAFGGRGLNLTGTDFLSCPLVGIDFAAGAIEFWIRPDYSFINGYDFYNEYRNRTLFHFTNSSNDVFGAFINIKGLNIYYGNINITLSSFILEGLKFPVVDELVHVGIVFSSNGESIDCDGSTIRVYFNNFLVGKTTDTWIVSDSKFFKFILGGQSLLALKQIGFDLVSSAVDGVISDFKIYNYCKTDFSDSLGSSGGFVTSVLTKPSEFIEISKDNLTFYKAEDINLPLIFDDVPSDEVRSVYVRSNIPKILSGSEKRTSDLFVQWGVAV